MIEVTLSGTAAASRLDAKAALDADLAPSSGEIALSAPEATALLEQLGLAVAPGDPLGRGEMKIAAKPTDAGSLAITANLSAGEAKLSGDGTLRFDQEARPKGMAASAWQHRTSPRLSGFSASSGVSTAISASRFRGAGRFPPTPSRSSA